LEADRQKMALQVTELQHRYDVPHWLRVSVQDYPWRWILGAVIFGVLLSRLPARKKEVCVSLPGRDGSTRDIGGSSVREKKANKVAQDEGEYRNREKHDPSLTFRLWSLIKPILTAFLAREIYRRLSRA
jgi:hypothetical protein